MDLEYKPDAAKAFERLEAWWEGEILDRPAIQLFAPKENPAPLPRKNHASLREKWMDVDYTVECADIHISNTHYIGEAFPAFWPNLGPDVLAAVIYAELEFGEDTSWSVPLLKDWGLVPELAVQPENEYTKTILALTRLALEVGQGKFLVGLTDIHPDADLAAALRDPQQLCLDLLNEPEQVKQLLAQLRSAFFDFYNLAYDLIRGHGQTVTTSWLPLAAEGRYYIPSNDFSCMVSNRMFREFFLEAIIEQVEWLDRSIYHLDGPNALQHLDCLLEIEKLDAVQYVWGAGNGRATDWIPTFQKIQDAGKNLWIPFEADELDTLMNALKPEGTMLAGWMSCLEEAASVLEKIALWPLKKG